MTGTGQSAIARATISSLNAQRSSIEPPPRADDDDVHAGDAADGPQAAGDLERRAFALHARRPNHDLHVRVPASQHVDDVADGGAVERRDDADLSRQRRQRPFARGVEQSLFLEPLLQLIEGELERAETLGLQVLADELILALRLVDGNLAAGDDLEAVGRLELQIAQRPTGT